MPGRTARRTASALLAGIFLLSLGGEAFGWHDCPHHHPRSGKTAATAGAGATAAAGAERTAPLRPASGPCTCVGSCHAAAASPHPSLAAPVPALAGGVFRVRLRPESRTLRPRLWPYLLPYPTGPPAA